MERRHDEEIQNTVLENGLHQPAHPGLAVVSFELQDEDDNANKSDKVCRGVRVLDIRGTAGNKYLQKRPGTCRSTWICQEQ